LVAAPLQNSGRSPAFLLIISESLVQVPRAGIATQPCWLTCSTLISCQPAAVLHFVFFITTSSSPGSLRPFPALGFLACPQFPAHVAAPSPANPPFPYSTLGTSHRMPALLRLQSALIVYGFLVVCLLPVLEGRFFFVSAPVRFLPPRLQGLPPLPVPGFFFPFLSLSPRTPRRLLLALCILLH